MSGVSGVFQITGWHEEDLGDDKLGEKKSIASVTQDYSGDLVGSSQIHYVMYYDKEGNAAFAGFETIHASLDDQDGVMVVKHSGRFLSGVARSSFELIPEQCSGAFLNMTGSGTFVSTENGQASYTITFL